GSRSERGSALPRSVAVKGAAVKAKVSLADDVPVVRRACALRACTPPYMALLLVPEFENCACNCRGVAGRMVNASSPVKDRELHAADFGNNNGQPRGHRFENRNPKRFN